MEKRGKKLIEEEQLLVRVHNGTVRTSGRKLFLLLRGRFEDDDQDTTIFMVNVLLQRTTTQFDLLSSLPGLTCAAKG